MNFHAFSQELERYDLSSCMIHSRGELLFHYEQTEQASSRLMPINSCTKSVLSALICMAMDQGMLPPADTFIHHFFPQLRHDPDERKQLITIQHLLTLTPGFQWMEFGGLNSFPTMTRSLDWVQFVLEQPLSDLPGTKMVYNSGASQLLAFLFAQASEDSVTQFAERNLFGPLGIEQYDWRSDPQGIPTGGFGLELTACDMLKFGLLYLHKGIWEKQELISPAQVEQSTRPFIAATPPERGFYGWHWWTDTISNSLDYYYARGFGGQFIVIVPMLEAVVVITRKQRKKGLSPHDLFREEIAPILIVAAGDFLDSLPLFPSEELD